VRGIFTADYTAALIGTIGIAVAQPLFLNAGTKLAANWFPLRERATVVGIGAVAPFLGIVIGQIATPFLVEATSIDTTMLIYGIIGAVSSLIFLLFARDHPPTPAGFEERVAMWEGFKHILKLRDFYLLAIILFVVNAIFNGVSTWVEVIVRPRGMDAAQAGIIGGLLMIGGIIGVFILPPISDRMHKRKPVFLIGLIATIPFLLLLTFISNFPLLAVVSLLLGIFMMGILPIALQYGTEICYPAPEGTSGGLLTLAGQLSVIAITAMGLSYEATGTFTLSLIILVVAMAVSAVLLGMMKESKMMVQE
jgi:MFS family permease